MIEKLKNVLLYGFGGMVAAIPFMVLFGSIYHYTDFFKAMRLDWSIIVLYCGACGGVMFVMWISKVKDRTNEN